MVYCVLTYLLSTVSGCIWSQVTPLINYLYHTALLCWANTSPNSKAALSLWKYKDQNKAPHAQSSQNLHHLICWSISASTLLMSGLVTRENVRWQNSAQHSPLHASIEGKRSKEKPMETKNALDWHNRRGHNKTWINFKRCTALDKRPRNMEIIYSLPLSPNRWCQELLMITFFKYLH